MTIYLHRENARQDAVAAERGVTTDDLSEEQEGEKATMQNSFGIPFEVCRT